jgi:hypothetical protein
MTFEGLGDILDSQLLSVLVSHFGRLISHINDPVSYVVSLKIAIDLLEVLTGAFFLDRGLCEMGCSYGTASSLSGIALDKSVGCSMPFIIRKKWSLTIICRSS